MNTKCLFINSEVPPIKLVRLGALKYIKYDDKIKFYELCRCFYPHPDAPNDAVIPLEEWLEVLFPQHLQAAAIQIADAMSGLTKSSQLTNLIEV